MAENASRPAWPALLASAIAIFMVNLDITIVNIVLPTLCTLFKADATEISLVVIGYMLSLSCFLLVAGKISDLLGVERAFGIGFWIFMGGSALCGFSTNLWALIIFRFIQGIGASFIFATAAVIVANYAAPETRGRAYSMNGLAAGVAFAFGSPVGGFLVETLGWKWVFFINIPIGIIGLICASASFRAPTPRGGHPGAGKPGFDWQGALLNFLCIGTLIGALHNGEDAGWSSPMILGLFGLSLLFLILFVRAEKHHPEPLLSLEMFRDRHLNAALYGVSTYLLVLCGTTFVLPFFLQIVKGCSPKIAGLYMSVFPAQMIIVSLVSGYLIDAFGPRKICIVSFGIFTLGAGGFLLYDATSSTAFLLSVLVTFGIGMALFVPANLTMTMTFREPGKEGMLSAVKALLPNLGATIGVSLFAFLYNSPLNSQSAELVTPTPELVLSGFRLATTLGFILAIIGFIVTIFSDTKAVAAKPSDQSS